MRRSVLVLALVAGALAPSPARATVGAVVVTPNTSFVPGDRDAPVPTLVVKQGTELLFVQADRFSPPHSVTSDRYKPNSTQRLFDSGWIQAGGTAIVRGVELLPPDTYRFHCAIHPQMLGHLTVV